MRRRPKSASSGARKRPKSASSGARSAPTAGGEAAAKAETSAGYGRSPKLTSCSPSRARSRIAPDPRPVSPPALSSCSTDAAPTTRPPPLLDLLDPQQRLVGLLPRGPLALPPGGAHWYAVREIGFPDQDTFLATFAAVSVWLEEALSEARLARSAPCSAASSRER